MAVAIITCSRTDFAATVGSGGPVNLSLPSLLGSTLRYEPEFQRSACSLPSLLPCHRLRRAHRGYSGVPGPWRRGIVDCREAYLALYERHPRTPAKSVA